MVITAIAVGAAVIKREEALFGISVFMHMGIHQIEETGGGISVFIFFNGKGSP